MIPLGRVGAALMFVVQGRMVSSDTVIKKSPGGQKTSAKTD